MCRFKSCSCSCPSDQRGSRCREALFCVRTDIDVGYAESNLQPVTRFACRPRGVRARIPWLPAEPKAQVQFGPGLSCVRLASALGRFWEWRADAGGPALPRPVARLVPTKRRVRCHFSERLERHQRTGFGPWSGLTVGLKQVAVVLRPAFAQGTAWSPESVDRSGSSDGRFDACCRRPPRKAPVPTGDSASGPKAASLPGVIAFPLD